VKKDVLKISPADVIVVAPRDINIQPAFIVFLKKSRGGNKPHAGLFNQGG